MQKIAFAKPPVIEVVFGAQFNTLPSFVSAHVGMFWQKVKAEFPRSDDAPPLPPIIETFGTEDVQHFEFMALPPMRRSWLITEDGSRLLQVQADRFHFNWKRQTHDVPYPGFEALAPEFERHLAAFVQTLSEFGIAPPTFRQFELSYINHIGLMGEFEHVPASQALIDHHHGGSPERFLPSPEGFAWKNSYPLPNQAGRLHISAGSALTVKQRQKVINLDITARGMAGDTGDAARKSWFHLAHEWIIRGFADSTSPELQRKVWGFSQ